MLPLLTHGSLAGLDLTRICSMNNVQKKDSTRSLLDSNFIREGLKFSCALPLIFSK